MFFDRSFGRLGRRNRNASWLVVFILLPLPAFPSTGAALPTRLILALDGISYRDMQALQAGVTYKDVRGRQFFIVRLRFHEGYFPVSRNVSTFPSTSDVAWTDIFGDRPLPGYQRTYFSAAANSQISHQRRHHHDGARTARCTGSWRTVSFARWVTSIRSTRIQYEVRKFVKDFLNTKSEADNYYVYIRTPDDAQHLARDIFAMLCMLDEQLQELRARYKAREGRELEILILSDHGNNHAGPGQARHGSGVSGKGRIPDREVHRGSKGRCPPHGWDRVLGGNP